MPKFRIVCSGWRDEKGKHHLCGKIIREEEMTEEQIAMYGREDVDSHTFCSDCYRKQLESDIEISNN